MGVAREEGVRNEVAPNLNHSQILFFMAEKEKRDLGLEEHGSRGIVYGASGVKDKSSDKGRVGIWIARVIVVNQVIQKQLKCKLGVVRIALGVGPDISENLNQLEMEHVLRKV